MKHETSAALYSFWLSSYHNAQVRAGGIDALELAPLLPDLLLIDLHPSHESRIRFCGASIATRYGRDLSDESFLALWGPTDRETLERDLRAMSARATGMVAGVMGESMSGGFVAYEMLLLPLAGAAGGAGALGSMVRIGGHEERNRIRRRLVGQWLRSIRFLPAPAKEKPMRRRAPDAPTAAIPVITRKRYGHLTVVNGGK